MALEGVERHVFTITDRDVASDIRQAVAAADIERLAELVDFLNIAGARESGVLNHPVTRVSSGVWSATFLSGAWTERTASSGWLRAPPF